MKTDTRATAAGTDHRARGRSSRAFALLTLIAAPLGGVAAGWWLGSRLPVVRYIVDGESMEPAYVAGDRVLVNRWSYRPGRAPAIGDVVVLNDPERHGHYLIKRIAALPVLDDASSSQIYVLGDNAARSHDSRAFGPLPASAIVGRAWLKY